jgi:hypothetical protein
MEQHALLKERYSRLIQQLAEFQDFEASPRPKYSLGVGQWRQKGTIAGSEARARDKEDATLSWNCSPRPRRWDNSELHNGEKMKKQRARFAEGGRVK